jgi:hypothetical protein
MCNSTLCPVLLRGPQRCRSYRRQSHVPRSALLPLGALPKPSLSLSRRRNHQPPRHRSRPLRHRLPRRSRLKSPRRRLPHHSRRSFFPLRLPSSRSVSRSKARLPCSQLRTNRPRTRNGATLTGRSTPRNPPPGRSSLSRRAWLPFPRRLRSHRARSPTEAQRRRPRKHTTNRTAGTDTRAAPGTPRPHQSCRRRNQTRPPSTAPQPRPQAAPPSSFHPHQTSLPQGFRHRRPRSTPARTATGTTTT